MTKPKLRLFVNPNPKRVGVYLSISPTAGDQNLAWDICLKWGHEMVSLPDPDGTIARTGMPPWKCTRCGNKYHDNPKQPKKPRPSAKPKKRKGPASK